MNGASESSALDFTLSLAFVKLLFTLITIYILDTTGRKMILVVGVLLVSFGMLVLTTAAVASSSGFNLFVQATALGLIVGGYGVGYGPVLWILSAEMFLCYYVGKLWP